MDAVFGNSLGPVATQPRIHPRVYQNRERRYNNDADVYAKLGVALKKVDAARHFGDEGLESAVKSLRNPIHRVVEFYATTILTGTAEQAFPLASSIDDALRRQILLVWAWSNLDQRKQVLKRYTGIYGQCFLKVNSPKDAGRVHLQVMKPQPFTDFDKDDRGNVVYVRLDTPFEREEGVPPQKVKKVRTEIWRKGSRDKAGYYRVWGRDADGADDTVVKEKSLSDRDRKVNFELSLANSRDSMGFDFVPFVDVSAMDTGDKRPKPVWEHALPLIDEQNRMATRLHDLLFRYNKPFKAVQGIGNDAQNRPLPPPKMQGQGEPGGPERSTPPALLSRAHLLEGELLEGGRDTTLGGDILFGLPGNAELADVTPKLDFDAARYVILDMDVELKQVLPQLLYSDLKDRAEQSGYALRTILAASIDSAAEMRANIQAGLIKADKMALTIAQVRGLPGFGSARIGTFDNGEGFGHGFEETEVLPLSDSEREDLRTKKIANAQALVVLGVPRERALKEVGLDVGGLAPESEGEPQGDEVARAAAIIANRNGNGGGVS